MTAPAFAFELLAPMAPPAAAHRDGPRHDRDAGLHAGGHGRDGEGDAPESVARTGAEILLGNTYHLMLRPGAERIARSAACTNS
jgi:queuine tRNA-ribosyltransferase